MSDNGDQFLRDSGILVPCAKQFGWFGWNGKGSLLSNCDRPYGHTGAHSAEGFHMKGGRGSDDDARTNEVLRQILEARRQ